MCCIKAGKGLGKNLEGRAQIVEAFLRKGKGAIGRYGPEGGRPKDKKADSDDEEEKEFKVESFFRREATSTNY